MSQDTNWTSLNTPSLCVAGDHDPALGMSMPIATSSSYFYLDEGPQSYPRYFNTPNQEAVARKIAALEHAEEGIVFSSGMAAISTCVMSLISRGDHVLLLQGLYGGTHSFLTQEFSKWGIEYDFVPPDINAFRQHFRNNTVLVYVESPTNPCLGILDLKSVAAFAKDAGIVSIIDNTFATPINQTPLKLGIDIAVHSATKYLGGHSDLSAGAAVGPVDLMQKVMKQARMYGGSLNATSCALLDRSIKTLDVRVERQNANAQAVAEFLDSHDSVTKVLYPGLPTHPGHDVAAQQMTGFGGMLSFELAPAIPLRDFLTRLKSITPAMSLGGVESTITVPTLTSHRTMSHADREACGVTPGLVRLSVGIEDPVDLIADLQEALSF